MANTLQIKRRTTAGTPSGLAAGELAVNLSDDKLYVGNAAANGVIHLNPSASTSYLPLTGGTLSGTLTIANNIQILGAADGVAYSFTGDPDTGVQSGGTNTLQLQLVAQKL